MAKSNSLIPIERIASRIYLIRGEKVMLDFDLAELYGVIRVIRRASSQSRAWPCPLCCEAGKQHR